MNRCIKCGGNDWRLVKDAGLMTLERCQVCNHEQMTLIEPADPEPLPDPEPVFRAMARWSRPPTTQDIDELRATFLCMPDTDDEIRRKADRHDWFHLGRTNESELRACAPLLTRLGLEVEPVPGDRA